MEKCLLKIESILCMTNQARFFADKKQSDAEKIKKSALSKKNFTFFWFFLSASTPCFKAEKAGNVKNVF